MTEVLSGEEFLCSVDYYTGRRVEDVIGGAGGESGSPFWTILLEGGAAILGYDDKVTIPKAIKGAALTRVDLSVHGTVLHFGLEQVRIDGTKYAMRDAQYTKGNIVFPQASNYNTAVQAAKALPPDPSADRISEGPSDVVEENLHPLADEE